MRGEGKCKEAYRVCYLLWKEAGNHKKTDINHLGEKTQKQNRIEVLTFKR